MNDLKLSDIADLQTGLILSRKEAQEKSYIPYKKISLKAINEYGEILENELDEFKSKELLNSNILTKNNDVIVKLFTPLNPCNIEIEYENLVVPAQLGIIRLKTKIVLPKYLKIYLSQDRINQMLVIQENGGTIRSLKLSAIADIEIPIPNIEKQKKIIEIYEMQIKQEKLNQKLQHEQEIYNKYVLEKLMEVQ